MEYILIPLKIHGKIKLHESHIRSILELEIHLVLFQCQQSVAGIKSKTRKKRKTNK